MIAGLTSGFFNRRHRRSLLSFFLFAAVAALLWIGGAASSFAATRTSEVWWMPVCVTKGGHQIDQVLMIIFWLTAAVWVVVNGVYIYFLAKYRRREGVPATYSHGNNSLEAIWTLIPALIFIALAAYSDHLWSQLRAPAPKDSLQIDVVAHQFGWFIRYPGPSGKLATGEQSLMTQENTFGTREGDPNLEDNFVNGDLVIPINKPVNIILRSQDVIHSFYVPEFRMYQDTVPGRRIDWVWLEADQLGNFQLACNQLCGSGHYNMKANVRVVTQEEFARWTREKSQAAMQLKSKQTPQGESKNAQTAAPSSESHASI